MKSEIKEILDEMKFMQEKKVKFYSLDIYQSKLLLDYITNLQEENKRLKEIENFKFSIRKDETKTPPIVTKSYKSEYEDYKSRNKKAIKYIKTCRDYHKTYHKEEKIFPDEITILLMILQGEDKE